MDNDFGPIWVVIGVSYLILVVYLICTITDYGDDGS